MSGEFQDVDCLGGSSNIYGITVSMIIVMTYVTIANDPDKIVTHVLRSK